MSSEFGVHKHKPEGRSSSEIRQEAEDYNFEMDARRIFWGVASDWAKTVNRDGELTGAQLRKLIQSYASKITFPKHWNDLRKQDFKDILEPSLEKALERKLDNNEDMELEAIFYEEFNK